MPNPLLFVGKGAALTAAARAADKANEGGGAFQRLGEGRGAAIRLAWPAEALHTVPHERRAAAGDADDPFAHGRPITKRARRAAGELRAVQHQERAEAPREAELAAAEERTAEQAALLAPLAATDTTARLAKRRRSALVAAVLHQPIAEPPTYLLETNARRTWHIALGPTDIPHTRRHPRAPHPGREKGE
ncbi:hypothetical protein EMIHUDRAFT_363833 [Emiliania huxleyi CCMP1516]|uniref:Uncharacterized protein n=2 Tax=Emiliania huxleyi TaxID=2903 RepID=A0A0D3KD56_EMIH1|nr:hypothetical protein EMIHUDRAFT_363833 [Emiliania huxleyi CCMP1516]EOD33691.1 hypothetical protein EMIHUDRAFT_363833 [Emiliania huxleyi CCMP1516]|eukprot:XP_005786120.1 hypothetical protein EMIHUDRAFT_363833 [Emiliania huxleyi CCMP1516]